MDHTYCCLCCLKFLTSSFLRAWRVVLFLFLQTQFWVLHAWGHRLCGHGQWSPLCRERGGHCFSRMFETWCTEVRPDISDEYEVESLAFPTAWSSCRDFRFVALLDGLQLGWKSTRYVEVWRRHQHQGVDFSAVDTTGDSWNIRPAKDP